MSEELVVKDHMVVAVTYTIVDKSGVVLEQSDIPIEYVHGVDQRLFPKITQNLVGKRSGETVELFFGADEHAFGKPDPELTFTDDLENVPPEFHKLGAQAMFQNEQGETITMTVTEINDGQIKLDGNNPLIGKDVVYHVTIVGIREASEQEIGSGTPAGSPFPTVH